VIRFVAPGALAGLVLALGPLLIHLLQRRQARRLVVPTVRFVPPVSHSSLRLRRPDDVLLLVLRTAAIAAAVVALAGPIILTQARNAAWNDRIVRAVVVDTSASTVPVQDDARVSSALAGASVSRRFDAERLSDGLARAGRWLDGAPPGRREVVVVSDLQAGSLNAAALTALPGGTGIRFERLRMSPQAAAVEGSVEYYNGVPHHREVTLDGWTTALTLARGVASGPRLMIEGTSAEQAARLERIVRDAGAATSHPEARVIVRFGEPDEGASVAAGAASGALLRLLQNEQLAGVEFSARTDGQTLLVTTSADPSSFEAASLVHAAVGSWRDPAAFVEAERERIPDETLQGWTREAAPADPSAWRYVDQTDARWFWALAVLCLGVEWVIRRRGPAVAESHARAA
jgi:hypothetical protein